jgi:hypothetical protein
MEDLDPNALPLAHTVAKLRRIRNTYIQNTGPKTWERESIFAEQMDSIGIESLDGLPAPEGGIRLLLPRLRRNDRKPRPAIPIYHVWCHD